MRFKRRIDDQIQGLRRAARAGRQTVHDDSTFFESPENHESHVTSIPIKDKACHPAVCSEICDIIDDVLGTFQEAILATASQLPASRDERVPWEAIFLRLAYWPTVRSDDWPRTNASTLDDIHANSSAAVSADHGHH